jgi:hypothetical protein
MSFERFMKERKYLHNVTPATIRRHEYSLLSLGVENPTADDLKSFVIRMRESGLSDRSPFECGAPELPACGAGSSV